MKHADIKAMMAEIAPVIREYTAAALAPLTEKIAQLEIRLGEMPVPRNGRDGVDGQNGKDGADGSSVTVEDVIPALKAEADRVSRETAEAILTGWEKPQDGKSVTVEELIPLVDESVRRAVSALPAPKDGADGRDGVDGKDGANGRDGADVVDLLIDRDGALVATLSDGRTKMLGPIVGKDGAAGNDGKEGAPGKDGADGVGFDDLDLVETDAGVLLRCVRGESVKEWRLPIVIDRGVWREGIYRKGDGVTWGGSFWIAQDETAEKPDSGGAGWRLAVKRGQNGKDGVMKVAPDKQPVRVG